MGSFTTQIEVGDPAGERFESLEALVDTGSTYTVVPKDILLRLGVAPHRRSTFELGDGRLVTWEMGRTWVRLNPQSELTLVVFGEEGTGAILASVTLEEFLLAPDPVHRRLIPVNALLMATSGRGSASRQTGT